MFKVGDIITGIPQIEQPYNITSHEVIMEVINTLGNKMQVKLIGVRDPINLSRFEMYIKNNHQYTVNNSECEFEYYNKTIEKFEVFTPQEKREIINKALETISNKYKKRINLGKFLKKYNESTSDSTAQKLAYSLEVDLKKYPRELHLEIVKEIYFKFFNTIV